MNCGDDNYTYFSKEDYNNVINEKLSEVEKNLDLIKEGIEQKAKNSSSGGKKDSRKSIQGRIRMKLIKIEVSREILKSFSKKNEAFDLWANQMLKEIQEGK